MITSLEALLPGDVVLTSHNVFDRNALCIKLANFFNRGLPFKDWTHAALYIGNGQVVEACPDGVKITDLQKTYINNNYELIVLRHKNASAAQLKVAVDFCKLETGDKYDWLGLTYFLLYNFIPLQFHFLLEDDFIGSMFHVSNSYFCSELVSTGFQKAGVYCFEWEPYKVMPVEFYNDLLFKVVTRFGPEKAINKWLRIPYYMASIVCIGLTIALMIVFGLFVASEWIIHRFRRYLHPA